MRRLSMPLSLVAITAMQLHNLATDNHVKNDQDVCLFWTRAWPPTNTSTLVKHFQSTTNKQAYAMQHERQTTTTNDNDATTSSTMRTTNSCVHFHLFCSPFSPLTFCDSQFTFCDYSLRSVITIHVHFNSVYVPSPPVCVLRLAFTYSDCQLPGYVLLLQYT